MGEATSTDRPILKIVLPRSPLRAELDHFIEPDFVDQVGIKAYDMLAERGGFEIVTRGDIQRGEFRCAQYVLATVKGEPWADEDTYIPIFKDPIAYLSERSYQTLYEGDQPEPGDIIAYGRLRTNLLFELAHMGIVIGEDLALSKINQGHVVKHPMGSLPSEFGAHAIFFRKLSPR